ncbi:MAG: tetratricopeptide repeat protein [Marinilabiliales bacterium]|nr:tetratricopeptide repeat protein [Marinilabiliales bacterium]
MFSVIILAGVFYQANSQAFDSKREAFTRSYSYEKEGNYDEAASALIEVYDEQSYEINLRLGRLYYNAGSFIESMDHYKKAIDLKPYALEARFGYVYPATAVGNLSQVEEQYRRILTVDPMNTAANYWSGMIYHNREQYEMALKHFRKVVNLYPFDYDSTIMYAWTHFKMGNLREAKVLFQQALLIGQCDESATEGLLLIQ